MSPNKQVSVAADFAFRSRAGTPAILTEVFCGRPQSLRVNAGEVTQIYHTASFQILSPSSFNSLKIRRYMGRKLNHKIRVMSVSLTEYQEETVVRSRSSVHVLSACGRSSVETAVHLSGLFWKQSRDSLGKPSLCTFRADLWCSLYESENGSGDMYATGFVPGLPCQSAQWILSTPSTEIEKQSSVALVLKRTIPTERPQLVSEVSANFCG
jgi:hypothetical protein